MSEPHQLEELLSVRSLAELLVHLTFWTSRQQERSRLCGGRYA